LAVAGASLVQVQAVRVVPAGGSPSRVELDLSRATTYRFFVLDNPRRAVVDIRGARAQPGLALPAGTGPVRNVRIGRPVEGTLRVVVELPDALAARALPATGPFGPGSRVAIELGAAAVAPAAAPNAAPASPSTTTPVRTDPTPPASNADDTVRLAAPAPAPRRAVPVAAAHAPADTGCEVVVAIDAGHGGTDPGAIGPNGTREKDAVLGIARALAERIDREPGMRAVLTRDGDYFLTLRQRMQRARAARADMFVSVHADSVRNPDVSGASVYVLSEKGATDEQARWLAERENAADLKGGVSLDDKDQTLASVLLDLSQSASITSSMYAAERVLRSLDGVGEVRKPRVQQAGFVVLKSPDIPSMLVETAYISNADDERRLRQGEHRERLAEAIFRGVHHYFEEHPPEGTRFALRRRTLSLPTVQAAR
jgi:N-acetylmuramoyl-L-alanine amidase